MIAAKREALEKQDSLKAWASSSGGRKCDA